MMVQDALADDEWTTALPDAERRIDPHARAVDAAFSELCDSIPRAPPGRWFTAGVRAPRSATAVTCLTAPSLPR